MKPKILTHLMVIAAMLSFGSPVAFAGPTKDELKQRAEKRYPELRRLKADGIVGETDQGFVDIVEGKDAPAEARKLVDEENADRRELYDILAKEGNTTPEQVARQAARRNLDRAKPGERIKENGKWGQKS